MADHVRRRRPPLIGAAARRRAGRVAVAGALAAGLAVARTTSALAQPDEPSADEIRETMAEVLRRPEFREKRSLIDRAVMWLAEQLADLLGFGSGFGGGAGGFIVYVVLALTVALIVWAVVHAVLNRTPKAAKAGPAVFESVDADRAPADWLKEAEQHERKGEWKAAVLCRYRALVRRLIDEGTLPDVPGRTTGEYRVDLAAKRPAASPGFDEATLLFELAWYADQPTGPGESQRFRALVDGIFVEARR